VFFLPYTSWCQIGEVIIRRRTHCWLSLRSRIT